jgi:beta-glucosidase
MKNCFRLIFLGMLCLLTLVVQAQDDSDYKNPDLPVEERVESLLAQMTLDEKIGQMTLIEKNSVTPEQSGDLMLGGILSGGGGYPFPNNPENWLAMVNAYQQAALETRLGIPIIYGVDAVHGHNNVFGATIFPHNIGLGATRNPELVEQIGRATAREMAATGIYWNYAPVVAVSRDYRWGRAYESFGEDTGLVTELATAYLRGLQGEKPLVLGTPKHFVGDGGTSWGTSTTENYQIDQGVTEVDEETLREVHLAPYQTAIENGAMVIMTSFSSWQDTKMHAQKYLMTDVLKGELGFEGFIVSDWQGIDQIPGDYYSDVVTAINAGIDMNMVPYNAPLFIETLREAVENGDVPQERVDDAVRRILKVKFLLGLFENPLADDSLLDEVGSEEHRELARQAVQESLVLLQNENNALPIAKDAPVIFVAGEAADSVGMQSGGWTIEWQGGQGNITPGTTILEAIEGTVSPETQVHYNLRGQFDRLTDSAGKPLRADVGIVVMGEAPYAEGRGDRGDLNLVSQQINILERMREQSDTLIVVLISGRPLVITDQLETADAWVAAWLPGTEGQGVADVLFGDAPFTGRLPFTWLRSNDQLPFDFANLPSEGEDAPLFPFGYGLTTAAS